MKSLFLATGFVLLCGFAIGQAKDGTAQLQKSLNSQAAASIDLPYAPEVVKKALTDYLSKTNDRGRASENGYLLSANTLLVKNYEGRADLHFLIDLKNAVNKNETVVYLRLNSSLHNDAEQEPTPVKFSMQNATAYLNNLAAAIKPLATELQLKLQQKTLLDARHRNESLITEGDKLEERRKKLSAPAVDSTKSGVDKSHSKKMARYDKLIDENINARLNLSYDISKQIAALALLSE